ncbi:MAG: hypothetical protein CMH83_16830 [Nocardioides sp.]|nr:hypothetical protein [Nocardioides sp.]
MSSHHHRFVTACQQMLVLGVVCAALTPAANVLSLDLVPAPPTGAAVGASAGPLAAYTAAAQVPSTVPQGVVDPVVREVPLTAKAGQRVAPGYLKVRSRTSGARSTLVSTPQAVTGYGAVGVTWQHGVLPGEDDIALAARYREDGAWSGWIDLEYHDDHGPDPDSPEAEQARPGTDELLVGEVDQVQVKVVTKGSAPADMKLAVVDPGEATSTTREKAAIDTATLPSARAATGTTPDDPDAPTDPPEGTDPGTGEDTGDAGTEGEAGLAAAAFTPSPVIYSRAQWGADERLREASSLHYYEVHAGFVHHTVNANDYSRSEVPGIIRSIYAYHTRSRGWSDIGYNFLVDRFGRIWEGRYGGVDRPVVGAHTLGYNDYSFAMSAIGNYETTKPTKKMVQAYGALFAWKLSLHGVSASSTSQQVGSSTFPAINGHRDAGQTACPGKYLYARIPKIRQLAAAAQVGFTGRQLESDLARSDYPDILVRHQDGNAYVIPITRRQDGSGFRAMKPIDTGIDLRGYSKFFNAGDWDRDGLSDVLARRKSDGALFVWRGKGNGTFRAKQQVATGFGSVGLLAAVGDVTGDGYPDLMGQPRGGAMTIYPGNGMAGLKAAYTAYSAVKANQQYGVGLWDRDGAPDSIFRAKGTLTMYAGNGPGGLTTRQQLSLDVSDYDWVIPVSDVRLTGHPDLVVRRKGTGRLELISATARRFAAPVRIGGGTAVFTKAAG